LVASFISRRAVRSICVPNVKLVSEDVNFLDTGRTKGFTNAGILIEFYKPDDFLDYPVIGLRVRICPFGAEITLAWQAEGI
jgi:hypothetical protein